VFRYKRYRKIRFSEIEDLTGIVLRKFTDDRALQHTTHAIVFIIFNTQYAIHQNYPADIICCGFVSAFLHADEQ